MPVSSAASTFTPLSQSSVLFVKANWQSAPLQAFLDAPWREARPAAGINLQAVQWELSMEAESIIIIQFNILTLARVSSAKIFQIPHA